MPVVFMKKEVNFKNIDDYPIIRSAKTEGETCSHWLDINGIDYLYKIESLDKAICEIFCGLVLNELGISSVNYYLASFHKTTGVITPNYNKEHLKTINFKEILKKYEQYLNSNHLYLSQDIWCLKKIKKVLTWYFPNLTESNYEELYDGLLTEFIASIFLANSDLNQKNIEIIVQEKPKISPCFDYGYAFNIKYNFMNIIPYYFTYNTSLIMEKPKYTLQKFLNNCDSKHLLLFKEKLEILKNINYNHIISTIKEENNSDIPLVIEKRIRKLYYQNIQGIDKIVKSQNKY